MKGSIALIVASLLAVCGVLVVRAVGETSLRGTLPDQGNFDVEVRSRQAVLLRSDES